MLLRPLLALAALASTTRAQAEDIPDNERLDVVFGPRPIHAPGALMHPGYMSNTPNISTPTWNDGNPSALLFMVDRDWPLNNERVSRLHWLVSGLVRSSTTPPPDETERSTTLLSIPSAAVEYMPPAPPVGDVAHSYAFYLFSIPPSFSLPSQYTGLGAGDTYDENGTMTGAETRAPFDVNQFLLDCGLDEEDVLARNHVRVRNLAGHPTQTFPPARQATGTIEDELPTESEGTGTQNSAATGGISGKQELVGKGMWVWSVLFVLSGSMCHIL